MESTRRVLGVTVILAALLVAACGGSPATTGGPPSTGAGSTPAPATAAPPVGGDFEARLKALDPALLSPIFGASIPAPTCAAMGDGGGVQCRWIVGDGTLALDADADPTFESEATWREAFGQAGFDEEIPGVGLAAIGGINPLSDGWRASAYASDGVAYTVTVNKTGDVEAVKAIVTAILKALAG
jgi:hypothetical protein